MIKEDVKEIRAVFPQSVTHAWVNNIERAKQPMIGYKAAFIRYKNGKLKPCIVKLLIPVDALYTIYYYKIDEKYGKHRCELAKVIGFLSYYTGKEIKVTKAHSIFYKHFCYELGEYVYPGNFSVTFYTCSSGIHYFNFLESARCYMDSVLRDVKYEFRLDQMKSRPSDPEIIRIASIKQRKNAHPEFAFSWTSVGYM